MFIILDVLLIILIRAFQYECFFFFPSHILFRICRRGSITMHLRKGAYDGDNMLRLDNLLLNGNCLNYPFCSYLKHCSGWLVLHMMIQSSSSDMFLSDSIRPFDVYCTNVAIPLQSFRTLSQSIDSEFSNPDLLFSLIECFMHFMYSYPSCFRSNIFVHIGHLLDK